MNRIGISPEGGAPNCIGGTFAAGAVVAGAAGDAIGVAPGDGMAVAVGDAAADGDASGVACATNVCPVFPRAAWPDGAATAVSPMLAHTSALRTPVLSRFNVAS